MKTLIFIGLLILFFLILWDINPSLQAKILGWKIGSKDTAKRQMGSEEYERKVFKSRITGTLVSAYKKK